MTVSATEWLNSQTIREPSASCSTPAMQRSRRISTLLHRDRVYLRDKSDLPLSFWHTIDIRLQPLATLCLGAQRVNTNRVLFLVVILRIVCQLMR